MVEFFLSSAHILKGCMPLGKLDSLCVQRAFLRSYAEIRLEFRTYRVPTTMSKLNIDRVKDAISGILDGAKEKPRKFVETIELQIGLKDYDTQRDKRFAGTVKLPHVPRMRLKVCILGDAVHCEQAQNLGLPFRSVDDLKKLNKNKKLVKKLALQYDAFLASQVRVFEMSQ